MATITRDTVVRRNPEAAHRFIDGTAVVVMPRTATMLTLNEVGSKIWELLGERATGEIAKRITDEFDVAEERALVDTLSFLRELLEREMVVVELEGG